MSQITLFSGGAEVGKFHLLVETIRLGKNPANIRLEDLKTMWLTNPPVDVLGCRKLPSVAGSGRGDNVSEGWKLAWRARDGCLRSISLFLKALKRAEVKLCICGAL